MADEVSEFDAQSSETPQEARKHPRTAQDIGLSEEWLFTALQSIGDAVIATNADGEIVFMNKVAVDLTGWSEEEAQGVDCRKVFHIVNESTREETESPVTKVIRDGVISGLANHTILIARDKTEHYIDDSGSPIRDKDVVLIGVVLIFRDITARRKIEKTSQEQQEILQTLFDNIPVIITFLDDKQQFKWANRECLRALGWNLKELNDPNRLAVFYPNLYETPLLLPSAPGSAAENETLWQDLVVTVKSGKTINIAWATVRLTDGSSLGIGYDVTSRTQYEAALGRQSHRIEIRNRQLEMAVRETDHRVKNDLQAVAALLDLQVSRNVETVPVGKLMEIRRHISTLATIHDFLVNNTTEAIGAQLISSKLSLMKLMPMIQEIVGDQEIECEIDDTLLPIQQGLSLAVLINELIQNAVKHGGRKVSLNLKVSDNTATLEVLDDGPGFTESFDPTTDADFGLELVETVGSIDLGGKTTYLNRPEGGACVRVTFPLTAQKLISPVYTSTNAPG